jgi:hypothetical protein
MTLRERAYRDGWIKERKLHMIWRAIARRWRDAQACAIAVNYHAGDDGDWEI